MAIVKQANAAVSDMVALERDMLSRLVKGEDDGEGHLAFALHRRAFLDWLEAFEQAERRAPDSGEIRLFLLGETAERRLVSYREQAAFMISSSEVVPMSAPAIVMPEKKPQRLRTWFWPWGFSTGFSVENAEQPLNWKGLFWRLLMLGLAVVVTALALRFAVVSP